MEVSELFEEAVATYRERLVHAVALMRESLDARSFAAAERELMGLTRELVGGAEGTQ